MDGFLRLQSDYIHINDVRALDGFMAWMPSLFCHQRYKARWALIFTQPQIQLLCFSCQIIVPLFSGASICTWSVSHTKLFTRIPLLAVLRPCHPEIPNQNKCQGKKWLWDIFGHFTSFSDTDNDTQDCDNNFNQISLKITLFVSKFKNAQIHLA